MVTRTGRTLFDPDALAAANHGGTPTMSMAQVQRAAKTLPPIPRPLPAPTALPDAGDVDALLALVHDAPDPAPDLNARHRCGQERTYAAGLAGPGGDFGVPEMAELGLEEGAATTPVRGGEGRALERLRELLADEEWVATFEKPAKAPTEWDPPATTVLSPHLHFGSLGVREFWWGVKDAVERWEKKGKNKGKASVAPVNLEGQLLFRVSGLLSSELVIPTY